MDKKTKIIIGVVAGVFVLGVACLVVFAVQKKNASDALKKQQAEDSIIQQQKNQLQNPVSDVQAQLNELEKLRNQSGVQAPTQDEVKQQLEKLDTLRQKSDTKAAAPTQADVQNQLKQLEELRKASK